MVLSEEPVFSGGYTGAYVLPLYVTQITSIAGIISDGFNNTARTEALVQPLLIAGSLSVNVELGTDAGGDDFIKDWRLVVWSEGKAFGAAATLNGLGKYTLNLPPDDDYNVRILTKDGREVANTAGVAVPSGLEADITVTLPSPATLEFRVVEEGTGKGVNSAGLTFYRSGKSFITYRTSERINSEDGLVREVTDLYSDEKILVKVSLPSQDLLMRYEEPSPISIDLEPGENIAEIILSRKQLTSIQGTITDEGGNPLKDVQMVSVQELYGKPISLSAQTDEHGRYSLELMPGQTSLTFSHRIMETKRETITLTKGESYILDMTLKRRGNILVDVYTKMAGQPEEFPLDMDWRVGVHFYFSIYNKTKDQRVNWQSAAWPLISIEGAEPGDEIWISLDGQQAGMTSVKDAVYTLDENKFARAEIHLGELGRDQARMRDVQGLVHDGVNRYVDIFRHEGDKSSQAVL